MVPRRRRVPRRTRTARTRGRLRGVPLNTARQVVLVTGCPRSGTTPVGDLLARTPAARELYEPFNRSVGDVRIQRYFEMPGTDAWDLPVDPAALVDDVVALRLTLRTGIFSTDGPVRRVVKRVTGSRTKHSWRVARASRASTLVWKDPFAFFWIPVVRERLPTTPVVVTHRPIGPVAGSFARLGWTFNAEKLTARYRLAYGDLPDAAARLQAYDLRQPHLNGAFCWALLYGWLVEQSPSGVTLVDMRRIDVEQVGPALARHVGLDVPGPPPATRRWSSPLAAHRDRRDFGGRAHTAHRDLSRVNEYWTEFVQPADARRIEAGAAELSEALAARSWAPPDPRDASPTA